MWKCTILEAISGKKEPYNKTRRRKEKCVAYKERSSYTYFEDLIMSPFQPIMVGVLDETFNNMGWWVGLRIRNSPLCILGMAHFQLGHSQSLVGHWYRTINLNSKPGKLTIADPWNPHNRAFPCLFLDLSQGYKLLQSQDCVLETKLGVECNISYYTSQPLERCWNPLLRGGNRDTKISP